MNSPNPVNLHTDPSLFSGVDVYAVAGNPIAHSKSPVIHQSFAEQAKQKMHYGCLQPDINAFAVAAKSFFAAGGKGMNVTVPFKLDAQAFADVLTSRAQLASAVNTLWTKDGKIYGDNTDGAGLVRDLLAQGIAIHQSRILLLGAGGAARAIVVGLLEQGVPEVRIANRTAERAQALADAFGPRVKVVSWAERNEAMADVKLLVNTTTQGMHGQPALDVHLDALPASAMVSDAIYIPLETPLLEQARKRGHVTVNGLGMLLNQAVPAFEAWFGVRPEVTAELRAAVQATF